MNHFFYLFIFALFVAAAFGIFANGSNRERAIYGIKVFLQFVGISMILAWVFYFIPW